MKLTKTSKSEERNVMRNVDRLIGRGVDALNDGINKKQKCLLVG